MGPQKENVFIEKNLERSLVTRAKPVKPQTTSPDPSESKPSDTPAFVATAAKAEIPNTSESAANPSTKTNSALVPEMAQTPSASLPISSSPASAKDPVESSKITQDQATIITHVRHWMSMSQPDRTEVIRPNVEKEQKIEALNTSDLEFYENLGHFERRPWIESLQWSISTARREIKP